LLHAHFCGWCRNLGISSLVSIEPKVLPALCHEKVGGWNIYGFTLVGVHDLF